MQYPERKNYTTWTTLALVLVLVLASLVETTVVCDGCRPISLQEGPGVGLSLSPGHGSAAVQFANGTILDIGIIEGTEEYVQAIKVWPSAPLEWKPEPTFAERPLWQRLRWRLGLFKPPRPQRQTPQSLTPLVDMVQNLWQKVNASLHLEYDRVSLSVSDFVSKNTSSAEQIHTLVTSAGLQSVRWWPHSTSSLYSLYHIEDCFDEMPECGFYRGRPIDSILSIHLDKKSLTLQSISRDDGMFFPREGPFSLIWRDNGTNLEDELRRFAMPDKNLDLVYLSGPGAPQIHPIIEKLFKDNPKIMSEDYVRDAEDYTFATARGAASLARQGMCNDFAICIPNEWCPISKHCESDFIIPWSRERTEL